MRLTVSVADLCLVGRARSCGADGRWRRDTPCIPGAPCRGTEPSGPTCHLSAVVIECWDFLPQSKSLRRPRATVCGPFLGGRDPRRLAGMALEAVRSHPDGWRQGASSVRAKDPHRARRHLRRRKSPDPQLPPSQAPPHPTNSLPYPLNCQQFNIAVGGGLANNAGKPSRQPVRVPGRAHLVFHGRVS